MEYYVLALKKYAEFEGRSTRTEYWMFFLVHLLITIGLSIITGFIGLQILVTLYGLALLIPALAAGARRLRDAGFTPWLLLIGLIPVIGWIALIVLLAQPTKAA